MNSKFNNPNRNNLNIYYKKDRLNRTFRRSFERFKALQILISNQDFV